MKRLGLSIAACAVASLPLQAQEIDVSGKIAIELNAAQTADASCTLSFMVTNGLDHEIDKAVYETVLFNTDGQVNRLTLFDFGTLPPARPRVRQFAVQNVTCEALGRVLFNSANTCEGDGLADGACADGLAVSTRTAIEVMG